jgi:hypothetical protein
VLNVTVPLTCAVSPNRHDPPLFSSHVRLTSISALPFLHEVPFNTKAVTVVSDEPAAATSGTDDKDKVMAVAKSSACRSNIDFPMVRVCVSKCCSYSTLLKRFLMAVWFW